MGGANGVRAGGAPGPADLTLMRREQRALMLLNACLNSLLIDEPAQGGDQIPEGNARQRLISVPQLR